MQTTYIGQLMHQGYITYVCQHIITVYNGFDKTMNDIIINPLPISLFNLLSIPFQVIYRNLEIIHI